MFKHWWTDWTGVVGPDGTVAVRVFYGEHEVEVGGRSETISVLADD